MTRMRSLRADAEEDIARLAEVADGKVRPKGIACGRWRLAAAAGLRRRRGWADGAETGTVRDD